MSAVFLNKKRLKILNNSGENNCTPIHIEKKVHLMYTNSEYVSGFYEKPSPLHQLFVVSYYQLY